MQRYWAVPFVALLMLSGCGANSSTHGTEKDIRVDVTITNHGAGHILITSPLELVSESLTEQDTANAATATPTVRLQIPEGIATTLSGATKLADIAKKIESLPGEKRPAEAPAAPDVTSPPSQDETYVTPPVTGESDDPAYKNKTTFAVGGILEGRQVWRIANKGNEFGQPVKLLFSNGHTVTIADTTKDYGQADGLFFDVEASHGGLQIQAPYGDTSKTVTLYYSLPSPQGQGELEVRE